VARFTIFGAAGFIGSHIAARLVRNGHHVSAVTRDSAPATGAALGHAIYCIGLTADFRDDLAATVGAHVSVLAEVLASYRFDSFLYLSSTRVYLGAGSTREDAELVVRPERADQVYNLSKLTGEALCLARPDSSFRVARLSTVVGAGDTPVNFLPGLVDEARRTGKVTLRTSPSSSKDYVDLDDAGMLLERISLDGHARLYNVASGVNTANAAIAALLARDLSTHVTYATDAPTATFPPINIALIRDEFGFAPSPFERSLAKLVGGAAPGEKQQQ
jgi:nucleoside-diphosphate-sugar epimerase